MTGNDSRQISQTELAGLDVLAAYPEEDRGVIWEIAKIGWQHPAGNLQLFEVTFEKAASREYQLLSFPLGSSDENVGYYVTFYCIKGLTSTEHSEGTVVMRRPSDFEWVDIGFGVPTESF